METKTEIIPCATCGTDFESTSTCAVIAGKRFELRQSHCDKCCEEHDRRFATKESIRESWSSICDAAYLDFDIAKLPANSMPLAARVFGWKFSPRGIGLAGESRIGKTFILTELCRRQHEEGKSVKMVLATEFAYACGSPDQSERRGMIESCIKADILFIDDIAKPKMTDRVEADLFHVLERRRRNNLPVFATLNGSGKDLAAMLSEEGGNAIVNRLRHDVCEFIPVNQN